MTAHDPSRCRECHQPRRRRKEGGFQGGQGLCNACYSLLPPSQRPGRHGTRPAPEDPYDLLWAAGEPERRIARAEPAASDLARCVARRDAEGVRLLLYRFSAEADWQDWAALAIVLAERAGPGRAVMAAEQLRGAA